MDELYNREERDEFVGVQLYYFKKALQFVDSQRYVVSDLGITVVIIEHYRTLFFLITGQIKFGIKRFDLPSFFYIDIAERHSTDTQYE